MPAWRLAIIGSSLMQFVSCRQCIGQRYIAAAIKNWLLAQLLLHYSGCYWWIVSHKSYLKVLIAIAIVCNQKYLLICCIRLAVQLLCVIFKFYASKPLNKNANFCNWAKAISIRYNTPYFSFESQSLDINEKWSRVELNGSNIHSISVLLLTNLLNK